MDNANRNENEFQLLNDAFPVLVDYWNNPTSEKKNEVSCMIYNPLCRMESKAFRRLPHWVVDGIDRIGLEDAKTTILLKILKGKGKGGIGDYQPAKGKFSAWVWRMMVRQSITLLRKVNARQNSVGGFELGENGEDVGMEKHSHSSWISSQRQMDLVEHREKMGIMLERYAQDCEEGDPLGHMVQHFQKEKEVITLEKQSKMLNLSKASLHRRRKASAEKILRDLAEADFGVLAL